MAVMDLVSPAAWVMGAAGHGPALLVRGLPLDLAMFPAMSIASGPPAAPNMEGGAMPRRERRDGRHAAFA